jgi:putative methionine-R-sulfoxide reductase with GAF domain
MTLVHKELFHELQNYALTAPSAQSVMERIANRLYEKMIRYNWAGFYLVACTN